jgi:hypothetical protein
MVLRETEPSHSVFRGWLLTPRKINQISFISQASPDEEHNMPGNANYRGGLGMLDLFCKVSCSLK